LALSSIEQLITCTLVGGDLFLIRGDDRPGGILRRSDRGSIRLSMPPGRIIQFQLRGQRGRRRPLMP